MMLRAPICDVKWLLMINVWWSVHYSHYSRHENFPRKRSSSCFVFAFIFPLDVGDTFGLCEVPSMHVIFCLVIFHRTPGVESLSLN